ncbi:RNA-directed DNA polymerase, eukaryota [Tanacetum coccineum]
MSNGLARSYMNVVNGAHASANPGSLISTSPALVLDDNCIIAKDFTKHAMGRVKDVNSIPNLQIILHDEGFVDVKLKYLGGMWVMFEFEKEETKTNMLTHTGVNSWFHTIQDIIHDFASDECIAWVDIEGSFKIIVKRKVFIIRAKELFTWNPSFVVNKETSSSSDDESVQGEMHKVKQSYLSEEEEGEFKASDVEGVAETIFDDNSVSSKFYSGDSGKQNSEDPFELYDLLEKKKSGGVLHVPSPSLSHPPGFTPVVNPDIENDIVHNKGDANGPLVNESSPLIDARMSNSSRAVQMEGPNGSIGHSDGSNGGSVLGVLEEVIKMNILSINVQGLGNKTKKEWIKELSINHKLNFIAIQETKMDKISHMDVKLMWGNSNYDFVCSDSLGNSGGILCIWETSIFKKDHVTISDNFVAIYGTWLPSNAKFLFISIYAPQQPVHKRDLWDYLSVLLGRWNGEAILMGDFNEVRSRDERRGSWFNPSGARDFNHFISSSGLVDVKLEGYSFTWSHPSATKMSKLDRFLVSDGVVSLFPSISALCLDRHLSDHRPILLREVQLDFGPIPFRFYHSWFSYDGFDELVEQTWRSFSHSDRNGMIRFRKKLQDLKITIRQWIKDKRMHLSSSKQAIHDELTAIDKELDCGMATDTSLARRQELKRQLQDIKVKEDVDSIQKSKVKWAIEGDENSSFFHGIINKRRSQLAIRGIFVKEAFLNHFEARFKKPTSSGPKIIFLFPKRLAQDQANDLERSISRDEIRVAVWNYGDNKSPGPDGYTFEFFKKYWGLIGPDFCEAVEYFFTNGTFSKGCNSSLIAFIPKVIDAKLVTDFRPISLIGCIYKVVTKIMANRLTMVISDIVSNTQSAFITERQILDGPFIINEILNWCKRKCKKAMLFKVNFAKAYDSVRWDYLNDVLVAFGFGSKWCQWIRGDPLAPLLFILMMESLHLSFCRVVQADMFKGIRLNSSIFVSHLFYADDALIIGEWSSDNLGGIINVLKCFYLASGLQINIHKSQLLGVGVPKSEVELAASSIGCSIMNNQFRYLGVMVGENMARHKAWVDVVLKLKFRLSKWKAKTLSIGGRLTLLKSVLGASPLYNMSIFKAPKGVLKEMESIRNNFFIGADLLDKKITWVAWNKVLASKKKGGLGVSSFYALNRALLLKWVWRFVSQDGSLWFQVIQAIYESTIDSHSVQMASNCCSILREMLLLKSKDIWKGDSTLRDDFPRMYALELDKQISVADKMAAQVDASFRRPVRGGIELNQFNDLVSFIDSVSLSSSHGRWYVMLLAVETLESKIFGIPLMICSFLRGLRLRDG